MRVAHVFIAFTLMIGIPGLVIGTSSPQWAIFDVSIPNDVEALVAASSPEYGELAGHRRFHADDVTVEYQLVVKSSYPTVRTTVRHSWDAEEVYLGGHAKAALAVVEYDHNGLLTGSSIAWSDMEEETEALEHFAEQNLQIDVDLDVEGGFKVFVFFQIDPQTSKSSSVIFL